MFDDWFWVGLATTFALLLIEHWIPWPVSLPRLVAYPLGVGAILVGLAVWLGQHGESQIMSGILAFALAAGIAVYGAYGLDWVIDKIKKALKAERMMRDGDA